jgi:ribosomal protein L11 methyltransferase
MPTLNVSIDLDGLDADSAEAACFEAGAFAVTYSDTRDDPILEPAPGEFRLWPAPRLTASFPADAASAALIASLSSALGVPAMRWQVEAVADRTWEREWLADFHAMRFGERLWVAPAHDPVDVPGAVVVRLDPGLAFGTGAHPTTALCLSWLDAHLEPGAQVIDYGCGSGILAIAAARLGAREAWAYDIDPQALVATRDNAVANVVDSFVHIVTAPTALPERVDVLLANILAGPLCELAPSMALHVRPGGALVLAGLLASQADEVAAAHAPWFHMDRFGAREGWVALAGRRRLE